MKKEETYKCLKDTPTGTYKAGVIDNSPLCELLPEYFGKYLGVTNNGSDVYAGDKLWQIRKDGFSIHPCCVEQMNKAYYNYFDSYESAQAHIDEQNKPKFEVGKVYKDPANKFIIYVTSLKDGFPREVYGYGINMIGHWFESITTTSIIDGCIEATPSEWEAALKKEAERKYPVGTRIKSLFNEVHGTTCQLPYFNHKSETIWVSIGKSHSAVIYENGKWASIIQEPKSAEWAPNPGFSYYISEKIKIYTDEDGVLKLTCTSATFEEVTKAQSLFL